MSKAIRQKFFAVDAFTRSLYAGNPAAVCVSDTTYDPKRRQQIASEFNLSETAFIVPRKRTVPLVDCDEFDLSWFTPTNEVPLCGHATLASAHVLFFELGNQCGTIKFQTLSGELRVDKGECDVLNMNFPANPANPVKPADYEKLISAVIGDRPHSAVLYSPGIKKLLIVLDKTKLSPTDLEEISPNFQAMMASVAPGLIFSVIVSLCGPRDCEYDFLSRNFAPWNGINEDPVTGSAHTVLVPYWAAVLKKTSFTARQCSKRGGVLFLKLLGERVQIGGNAIVSMDGHINVPTE